MRYVVAPQVNVVRDALGGENVAELNRALRRFVVSLTGENVDMLFRTQLSEQIFILKTRQVINRTVEIAVVIVVTIAVGLDVI